MRRARGVLALAGLVAILAVPAMAPAHTAGTNAGVAALLAPGDAFQNFSLKAAFPLSTATSSDIAFWGDRAFVGNYGGFRIFDISDDVPELLADVRCLGAQGDPSVWDRDGDGTAALLILSVDRTMAEPQCGAAEVAHDEKTGWEGLRIF